MIVFKSEIKEYEDRIRKNIPRLIKALKKEENLRAINRLLDDIFDCTCVNNMPIFRFDCTHLSCSECKKIFIRELIIRYGKKNNIEW